MPEHATDQTGSGSPVGQPASIRPWLVFLFLGVAWGLVILLTVKSFVPYGGTTVQPTTEHVQIDEQSIQAIQARLIPGGTKEGR